MAERARRAGLVLALAPFSFARPHPGPPIWADLVVSDHAVRFDLRGEVEPLATCLGYDGELLGPMSAKAEAAARAAVERFLKERVTISIDGVPRAGELSAFELPEDLPDEDGWLFVEASYSVPVDALPRKVGIVWEGYEGTQYMGETYVPVLVRHGRDVDMISLYPAEPEYVWHAREPSAPRAPVRTSLPVAPVRARPGSLYAAFLLAVLAAGFGSLAVTRPRRGRLFAAGAMCAAALCAGAALFAGRHACTASARVPAQDQALAIFQALQANVYASFEADGEQAIYDLLAASVEPGLLDELYAEVYESLVLREQGGAMCTVEALEPLGNEVDLVQRSSDERPAFRVASHWRVRGLVAHWGHVHRRTNEYRATYTLRHDGAAWRIGAVDVHEHQRLEDPG